VVGLGEDMWLAVYSDDGSRLVTADRTGETRAWDPTTGHSVIMAGVLRNESEVVLSSDGDLVAVVSGAETQVLDTHTGAVTASVWGPVEKLSFGEGGSRFVTLRGGVVSVWGSAGGLIGTLEESTNVVGVYLRVRDFSIDQSGDLIATANTDGTIRIWDWRTLRLLRSFTNPADSTEHFSFGSSGKVLVVGGHSGLHFIQAEP
jgi:WD40 repeat protein